MPEVPDESTPASATSERPPPTAEGTFAKTPLPQVLVYVLDRQLTGTIDFIAPPDPDGTARWMKLLVLDGRPAKARTSGPVAYLGSVARALGFIDDAVLNASLAVMAKEKRLHGQILLEMGALTEEQLLEALRMQLLQKIEHVIPWPAETRFAYYDGFDALHAYGADDFVQLDPLSLVWTSIRAAPPWEHVHATLTRVAGAALRLSPTCELDRFEFLEGERVAAELLRESAMRVHDLVSLKAIGAATTQLLAYCLLITKQVDLVTPAADAPGTTRVARVQLQQVAHRGIVEERHVPTRGDPRVASPLPPRGETMPVDMPVVPTNAVPLQPPLSSPPPPPSPSPQIPASSPSLETRPSPVPRPSSPSLTSLASPPARGSGSMLASQSMLASSSRPSQSMLSSPSRPSQSMLSSPSRPSQSMLSSPSRPSQSELRSAAAQGPQASASSTGTRPSQPGQSAPPSRPSGPPSSNPPAHLQPSSGKISVSRTEAAEAASSRKSVRAIVTPALETRRREIIERAATIKRENYFEMLGVPENASVEQVQSTFFGLAKVWHPDRVPGPLADVRDACASVFSHMSEAHQTLIDPKRRENYMKLLREGGATPDDQAQIVAVVEAATNFQKAEICLRRNDLVQAESLCKKAHDADPKQPDYLALLTWLEAQKPENQSPAATLESISRLDFAIQINDRCERAIFYRGMLQKRIQNTAAAVRDFRRAAELNPRNIDAIREVRLHEMRKGRTSSPPPLVIVGEAGSAGAEGDIWEVV